MKKRTVSSQRNTVRVADFLETAGDSLKVHLVAGESGLRRSIIEPTISRPGLALTGFFKHFAYKRIQVIGMAEHAYLTSLSDEERRHRLNDFFASRVPCVVVSRNKRVFHELHELAEEFKVPVLQTAMVTKHFINAATIIMENMRAPTMKVQGTMVEILGVGVLLEGKAGMGKSETALGLIKKGYALVSDDITSFRLDSAGSVLGSPVSVTRYHMEIRGLGIIHVPSLFGVSAVRGEKVLDLVVSLREPGEDEDYRGGGARQTRAILGKEFPCVSIPVAPGRDIVNVVETAALDQKLRRLGHDAAKELDEKLMRVMLQGGKDGSE